MLTLEPAEYICVPFSAKVQGVLKENRSRTEKAGKSPLMQVSLRQGEFNSVLDSLVPKWPRSILPLGTRFQLAGISFSLYS